MSTDTDYAVLREVLGRKDLFGWAAEFGVASGYSLGVIAEHMPVIGFDSFKGLPEDWRPGFPKGKFATRLSRPQFDIPANSMIVPGMFEESLPRLLRAGNLPKLGLVHIDCDLYSSSVVALNGVADFIGAGSYVIFDEFQGYPGCEDHEMKAWTEFCESHLVYARSIAEGVEERAFYIEAMGV